MTKEDIHMLEQRLYPQVNQYFMKQIAEQNGINISQIETLDYSENDLFKQQKMIEQRQYKAKMLKGKDTSEYDVKYKNYEQAVAEDKDGKHLRMNMPIPLEELEKQFPKLKVIDEEIVTLDDLSSDDEKA